MTLVVLGAIEKAAVTTARNRLSEPRLSGPLSGGDTSAETQKMRLNRHVTGIDFLALA